MPAADSSIESEPKQLAHDPRWALVRRIVSSSTFARSEQLPKLLLYICRMAITNREEEINEQRIGVEVYGRSPNYDSAADGIVRSHATRLRQRLDIYFGNEGAHEQIRIEIPRGGYIPRFYAVDISETAVLPKSSQKASFENEASSNVPVPEIQTASENQQTEEPATQKRLWVVPFFLGLAIAACIAFIVIHLRQDAALATGHSRLRQSNIERQFWDTLFPSNGKTLVVPGDSGLVLYETVTGQQVTLFDYINGAYRDPDPAKPVGSTASEKLTVDLASRRYTSIIDLDLVTELSHLPEWNVQRAEVIYARDLRPAAAEGANLILIGSRQANPWVSLVEPSMNFVLVPDSKWGFHFHNRHPLKNEQTDYTPHEGDSENLGATVVYGEIAYFPNPSGQGMVLVLSGLWMSGTQSSGQFVLNSDQFSNWLKSIQKADGTIPPFELLIGTKNLLGNATYSSIIAKRVQK